MSLPTNLVIPFSKLTADQCRVVAERGAATLAFFSDAEVGRVLKSRLQAAVERLNQIADRGRYGATLEDLQLDVRAVAVATDFFQIATVLPPQIPPHVARELATALEQRLGRTVKARVPEQFLSQFWAALVLARGGVSPGIVKPQQDVSTPDYLVSVDTLPCAVEVKRPESDHSAPDTMDQAAEQVRDFGKPGFIMLDLTDAIFRPEMSVQFIDHPGLLIIFARNQFVDLTNRLEGRARNYRRSDKYARVMGVVSFARLHYWESPDLSQPKGSYLFSSSTFPAACSGLVFPQAQKLVHIIASGASEVAGGRAYKL